MNPVSQALSQPTIKVKRLHDDAVVPRYVTAGAAGMDLHAVVYPEDNGGTLRKGEEAIPVEAGARVLIRTGLAFAIPAGFEMQIRPRSGLALKHGITVLNTPGTIDADYRGEVGVILFNSSSTTFYVNPGDRIAQAVIAPVADAEMVEVQELGETDRGAGGFGSTGVAA